MQPTYIDSKGRRYYNHTEACAFLSLTDTGLRRRYERLKNKYGINVPHVRNPRNTLHMLTDERVLMHFQKAFQDESVWAAELKQAIEVIHQEYNE